MANGGGGGGYNIPVSLSAADTFSVPQTVNSPVNIVYGSANKTGGDTEVSPVNYNPATAVASAALGGTSNASAGGTGLTLPGSSLGNKTLIYVGAGVAAAVLILAVVLFMRKR